MLRELRAAFRARSRASARRRDLPVGSSRARLTTANARWMTACEEWDRVEKKARDAGMEHLVDMVRGEDESASKHGADDITTASNLSTRQQPDVWLVEVRLVTGKWSVIQTPERDGPKYFSHGDADACAAACIAAGYSADEVRVLPAPAATPAEA